MRFKKQTEEVQPKTEDVLSILFMRFFRIYKGTTVIDMTFNSLYEILETEKLLKTVDIGILSILFMRFLNRERYARIYSSFNSLYEIQWK